jgi:hypothetical protein
MPLNNTRPEDGIDSVPADKVKTSVLVEWLYEASKPNAMSNKGMRRLCWLAAEKLSKLATTE